jgi:uncharacterized protein YjiS (DUF1127 family)
MLKSMTSQSADNLWPDARSPCSPGRFGWRRIALRFHTYLTSRAEQRRLLPGERQLEGLDDRMLKDIGISRSDIRWAVRHGRGF